MRSKWYCGEIIVSSDVYYEIENERCATERRHRGMPENVAATAREKKTCVVKFSPEEARGQRVFCSVSFVSDTRQPTTRLPRVCGACAAINVQLFRIRRRITFVARNRRFAWPWNYFRPTSSILRIYMCIYIYIYMYVCMYVHGMLENIRN